MWRGEEFVEWAMLIWFREKSTLSYCKFIWRFSATWSHGISCEEVRHPRVCLMVPVHLVNASVKYGSWFTYINGNPTYLCKASFPHARTHRVRLMVQLYQYWCPSPKCWLWVRYLPSLRIAVIDCKASMSEILNLDFKQCISRPTKCRMNPSIAFVNFQHTPTLLHHVCLPHGSFKDKRENRSLSNPRYRKSECRKNHHPSKSL